MSKCSCKNCDLEVFGNSDKCILHIEKLDYPTDFNKVRFLNNFYEELFTYVINYEEITNFIKIQIKIDYSEEKNIESEKFFEILNDEEKLKKVTRSYFEIQNEEQLDKYFAGLIINEIENSDSSIDGSSLQYYLDEFFKEKIIIFKQIFFPTYDDKDKFNYMKIIRKLKKIHFDTCKFKAKFFDLTNIEIFFLDCEFLDSYSISNSAILENESDVIYQNCTFHRDVSISTADDKSNKINHTLFSDCKFKKDLKAEKIEFEKGIFNNTEFDEPLEDKEYLKIDILEIKKCMVKNNFIFRGYTVNKIDLTDTVFEQDVKVKIQFCDIKEEAIFYNTKFKDLADFYQTGFKKVNFERTDFEKISVFSECEFNCDVDFKYTKFLGKSIFMDTVITRKLDLRNAIFEDDAYFLDITSKKRDKKEGQFVGKPTDIKVANRETARVIKSFYDYFNNIIEANKFYALEMKEREKELERDKKNGKNIFEWLIFKIHGLASNHSQDWLLSLFWILSFTFTFLTMEFINTRYLTNTLEYIVIDMTIFLAFVYGSYLIIEYEKINKFWYIGMYYIFYGFFSQDWLLKCFANKLNPFSIMTGSEKLTFGGLIYKIIIAYLIYQLIISIRQNTRRK